jgi:hypothetical protein
MITLKGVLEKDGSGEFPSRIGITDKPITFSGSGVTGDLKSKGAKTGAEGKFTVEGKASDIEDVLEVQAHFKGDEDYNASDSNVENYTTQQVIATTFLKLDPIPGVNVRGSIAAKGVLGVLTNDDQGDGIKGKNITFITTGGEVLNSVITDDNGRFSVTGKASDNVGEWDVKAQFAGDADYNSSSDVETYKTIPIHIDAPAITVQQVANEGYIERTYNTFYGIPLHIYVADIKGCPAKVFDKYGDSLDEISMQAGDTLNYKARDKGIPKTIEYTIKYICDPNLDGDEIMKKFEDVYNTTKG